MVIFRGPPRFPARPAFPPDYTLPEGWQDWEGGSFTDGILVVWSGAHELRKLQVVFKRIAPAGVATDPAVITMHFLNLTGGVPDATWTDADFVVVENAFDTFWTARKGNFSTGTILDQYRWYKDGPAYHPTPEGGNAAVRVIEKEVPGTAAVNPLPPQVAISITERTAIRRRWGRIYLPAPALDTVTTAGLVDGGLTALLATNMDTMYESCITAGIVPVVWSPTIESSYQIEKIQVDNLYDVIRSRRWKAPTTREVRDLTQ